MNNDISSSYTVSLGECETKSNSTGIRVNVRLSGLSFDPRVLIMTKRDEKIVTEL